MAEAPMRVIAVGVIQNQAGEILLCKKPGDRGVFPGQWALPGGGLEAGENAEAALRREMLEEVGLEMAQVEALFFSDGRYPKLFADGSQQEIYMVFLIYLCRPAGGEVRLNDEFEAYTWAGQEALGEYDLNIETAKTLQRMGLLPRGDG